MKKVVELKSEGSSSTPNIVIITLKISAEKGFVKEVDNSKLVIDLENSIAAERAAQQLIHLMHYGTKVLSFVNTLVPY